ncbi:Appr-1-p processing enzyme family protein, partial [Globisporangium splendens]
MTRQERRAATNSRPNKPKRHIKRAALQLVIRKSALLGSLAHTSTRTHRPRRMSRSDLATKYKTLVFSIAKSLLAERGYSQHHIAGEATGDVREIVQHLLVTRPPPEEDELEQEESLYTQVDELLQLEQIRQVATDAHALPSVVDGDEAPAIADLAPWNQIALWKGDITTLKATAIVNAANSALLGCFQPTHKCIDNVIHCKAGPRLRTACHDIMSRQVNEEPVGHAKITPAFALPSKHVIHTVGPQLSRGQSPTATQRAQLKSSYTSSLDLLLETVGSDTPASIAFPCISTGLFAFPSDIAVPLAVSAVVEWLKDHPDTSSWRVVFNTFLQNDYDLYKQCIESQHVGLTIPAPTAVPALESASELLEEADYLLITAGAGLSAAAGLDYTSEAVMKKFHPSLQKRGLRTMYHLVGRTDFPLEFFWGYYFTQINNVRFNWTKHRTAPTYATLKSIRDRFESKVKGSTFVATSNADGMFGQEGFDLDSVYTMQGDYGYLQCKTPCSRESVFDMKPFIDRALPHINPETYHIDSEEGMPKCPNCGGDMYLSLLYGPRSLEKVRAKQKKVYQEWLSNVLEKVRTEDKKLVILEIGVGFNTPGVLRLPDERLATVDGVSLVRVNEAQSDIPFDSNGLGVAVDANDALEFLQRKLAKLKLTAVVMHTTDNERVLSDRRVPRAASARLHPLGAPTPARAMSADAREPGGELQFLPTARELAATLPVLAIYGELLTRFERILTRFAVDDAIFRLMLSRQFFVKMDQLHRGINIVVQAQQQLAALTRETNGQDALSLWRLQWDADRRVQQALDQQRSGYAAKVSKEQSAIENEAKQLCAIRDALDAAAGAADATNKPAAVVIFVTGDVDTKANQAVDISKWIIVVPQSGEGSRLGCCSSLVSTELETVCEISRCVVQTIEHSNGVHEDRDIPSRLQGFRLVCAHGACHLCVPVYFAFQDMERSSKASFDAFQNDHGEQLVRFFYQVELGLHLPHENQVFGGKDAQSVCRFGVTEMTLRRNADDATMEMDEPKS